MLTIASYLCPYFFAETLHSSRGMNINLIQLLMLPAVSFWAIQYAVSFQIRPSAYGENSRVQILDNIETQLYIDTKSSSINAR